MSVRVTLVSNAISGGSQGAYFDDTSFSNAAAAVAAASGGFIVFPSPVDPGGTPATESRAFNVSQIASIVTLPGADPSVSVTA